MIWVDCDGVLADFTAAYLQILNAHTGRSHSDADITSFDFGKCIASKEEDNHVWREFDRSPGLIAGLADLPGAEAGLSALRKLGKVGCLTSPHLGPYWMPERARWLQARGFTKREIIFASDKSHVAGSVLVDDRFDNCLDWAKANPNGLSVCLTAPWNKDESHWHVQRADSWGEVLRHVEGHL